MLTIHIKRSHLVAGILVFAILFGIRLASAWTNPTQAPPNGNVSLPSAQWTASGTVIYNSNSGSVGVGTSSPAYKLDAYGTFRATATSTFSASVGIRTTSPASDLHIAPQTVSEISEGLRIERASNPQFYGVINTSGGVMNLMSVRTDGTTDGWIYFKRASNDLAATTSMVIDPNGNVGIGTTNPGLKLDVVGTVRVQSGDVSVYDQGKGLILHATDQFGVCFRVVVNNAGQLATQSVSCP